MTPATSAIAEDPSILSNPSKGGPEAAAGLSLEEEKLLSTRYAEVCDQVFEELCTAEGASKISEFDSLRILLVANRFAREVASQLGVPFGSVLLWSPQPVVAEALEISPEQLQGLLDQPLAPDQMRVITGFHTNVTSLPNAHKLLCCFADTFKGEADKLPLPL